jgi:hypothetical protein
MVAIQEISARIGRVLGAMAAALKLADRRPDRPLGVRYK